VATLCLAVFLVNSPLKYYAHALQEADQAAADKFDFLFAPKGETKVVK
jgi:hypothetical protein